MLNYFKNGLVGTAIGCEMRKTNLKSNQNMLILSQICFFTIYEVFETTELNEVSESEFVRKGGSRFLRI